MSEITAPEAEPRKRRLSVKAIVIIGFILAFAVGMGIEVYKHSHSRMKSLLADNRDSFEACADYFGKDGAASYKPSDAVETAADDSVAVKRSTYATLDFLADKFKDEPVSADLKKLSDAGVQKITLTSDGEVRFYTDTNSGLCYISQKVQSDPGSYYPEGYLDDNRIDGDWYRFGADVKKKD